MNFFALNGAAIDGSSGLPIVQASANFSVGVSVSVFIADGTRTQFGTANFGGGATAAVTPTHTQAAAADISNTCYLTAAQTFIQAASANIAAGVDIVSFVLRTVQASASIGAGATLVPIPASVVGAAAGSANATVTAAGTTILATTSAASAGGGFTANASITRYVSAAFSITSNLNAEWRVNGVHDTYANIVGTSNMTMPDIGITFRMAAAAIAPSCSTAANGTQQQPGTAGFASTTAFDASVYTLAQPTATFGCSATVTPDAARVVLPTASIQGTTDFALAPKQTFAGVAAFDTGATATPNATRYAAAAAVVSVGADAAGSATRIVQPTAAVVVGATLDNSSNITVTPSSTATAGASFGATATVTQFAAADVVASSNVVPIGVAFRMATADIIAGIDTSVSAEVIQLPTVMFNVGAGLAADGVRFLLAAATMAGSADLTADSRTNADAVDPPWRTVRRSYRNRVLHRPYTQREFKRAA